MPRETSVVWTHRAEDGERLAALKAENARLRAVVTAFTDLYGGLQAATGLCRVWAGRPDHHGETGANYTRLADALEALEESCAGG